jgi:hypothetical protein
MALAIGVHGDGRTHRGTKILVGEKMLEVRRITAPGVIVCQLDKGPEFIVTEVERTQIMPDVFVQAAEPNPAIGARLTFEAPRSIKISRLKDVASA